MIFIMTNRTRLGSQKRIFRRLESRYIAKHNQKKDIVGIVANIKLTMPIFA